MFVFQIAIVAAESGFFVGTMYNHGVGFVQLPVALSGEFWLRWDCRRGVDRLCRL